MFGVDDAIIAAGIAAAGSAYSAHSVNSANAGINAQNAQQALDFFESTQREQRRYNEEGRAYNTAEAIAQRDWQTSMASTSHQRTVKDLEAAGLNPMLAITQGQNAVPSTGMASQGTPSAAHGQVAPKLPMQAVNLGSAVEAARVGYSLQKQDAEVDLLHAQAEAARGSAGHSASSAKNLDQQTKFLESSLESRIREQQFDQEHKELKYRIELELETITKDLRKGDLSMQQANTALKRLHYKLDEMGVPKGEAYRDYYKTPVGRAEPYVNIGGELVNSAASIMRGGAALKGATRGRSYNETHYDSSGNVRGGMSRNYGD